MDHLRAGGALEQLTAEMRRRAGAGRTEIGLVTGRFKLRDDLLERRILELQARHDDLRIDGHQRQRRENPFTGSYGSFG